MRISNGFECMALNFFFSVCVRLKFNDSNNWLFGKAMCALLMMCVVTAQVQRGAQPPPEATSWPLSHTKEKAHKKQILLGKVMLFIMPMSPLTQP